MYKCRLVTKHVLFITHFPSYFFLTFPLKYYLLAIIFKLSDKDNLLLIYTFIGMIIFSRSFHLGFQSHQMCTFSAGFGMPQNLDWLSWSVLGHSHIFLRSSDGLPYDTINLRDVLDIQENMKIIKKINICQLKNPIYLRKSSIKIYALFCNL